MEPRNLRDDPIQAEEIESKLKTAIESQACVSYFCGSLLVFVSSTFWIVLCSFLSIFYV